MNKVSDAVKSLFKCIGRDREARIEGSVSLRVSASSSVPGTDDV